MAVSYAKANSKFSEYLGKNVKDLLECMFLFFYFFFSFCFLAPIFLQCTSPHYTDRIFMLESMYLITEMGLTISNVGAAPSYSVIIKLPSIVKANTPEGRRVDFTLCMLVHTHKLESARTTKKKSEIVVNAV